MNEKKLCEAAEREKLIVIVRGVCREALLPLAEAMYDGGIRFLEITYDASGRVSDTETAENISMLAERFDGRMHIGAGTVIGEEQVVLTKKAGGKFIISPDVNPAVIGKTKEQGLVSMPGALTPTEILLAHRSGADFVKLFPVTSMGPAYVKAVKAPLSNIKLLAVGGIDENNIGAYLRAGVCGFGIGSNIAPAELVGKGDFGAITELAKKYVAAVRTAEND